MQPLYKKLYDTASAIPAKAKDTALYRRGYPLVAPVADPVISNFTKSKVIKQVGARRDTKTRLVPAVPLCFGCVYARVQGLRGGRGPAASPCWCATHGGVPPERRPSRPPAQTPPPRRHPPPHRTLPQIDEHLKPKAC